MNTIMDSLRPRIKNSIRTAFAVLLIIALSAVIVPGPEAGAVPDVATKSEEAARIAREIDSLDQQLAIAAEAYNRVKSELDAVKMELDETRQRLYEIKQSLKSRTDVLNGRAVAMYKNGKTSMLDVLLNTEDFGDFLQRADYVARMTESDAKLVNQIRDTRDSVSELERQITEQERQKYGLVQQAAAKKVEVEAKLNERREFLSNLNEEIQKLLEEERRRRSAESSALEKEAEEVLVREPEAGLANTAMKYLGIPYHWAGEGPGKCPTGEHRICFDCSGLTMYVYKLHGISLPHNAAMQFNRGIKIPLAQARPGDLVFFGSPPHHVGMYIDKDLFLHAPCTGDVVKVSRLSARSDLSGVCRYSRSSD